MKYEFTGKTKVENYVTLHQIKRISDGLIGGWIEKEENLSQDGRCFVSGDAEVYGNARVYGNALVYGDAKVYGNAWIYGNAMVYGNALVSSDAKIYDNAEKEPEKTSLDFSFKIVESVTKKYIVTKNNVTIELSEDEVKRLTA